MNATTVFKELDDGAYTRLRKNLLRVKGGEQQRLFLKTVRDSATLQNWFAKVPTVGSAEATLATQPMTENEYKDPPSDTEQELYNSWRSLTLATACRSTFWAHMTLEHIRAERIESVFLAANGGNLAGGAERIDSVLRDGTAKAAELIDSCVRAVLRRLGGLPEVRGNRSVYVDCPFARAWWRERLVNETTGNDTNRADQVRKVTRVSQTYWEKLIDRIVVRNSTFGSANIRSAFLSALAQSLASDPGSSILEVKVLQRLCRRATAFQGTRELSILSDDELDEIMRSIIQGI